MERIIVVHRLFVLQESLVALKLSESRFLFQ